MKRETDYIRPYESSIVRVHVAAKGRLKRNIRVPNVRRLPGRHSARWGALLVVVVVAALSRAAAVEHNHIAGDHLGAIARLTLLILPLVRLEPALDVDTAALAEVFVADLGEFIPGDHVEPLGFLARFAGAIFPLTSRRDAEGRHWAATGRVAHLRVFTEPPNDHDFVQIFRHLSHLSCLLALYASSVSISSSSYSPASSASSS